MELTRGASPAMLSAMDSAVFYPVSMVYLDWPTGPVYAHSSVGAIRWGGHEWGGVGNYGAISIPDEAGGEVATEAVLSIIGSPEDLESAADAQIRRREGAIYTALVTERAGNVLVAPPVLLFRGLMDAMVIRSEVQDSDGQTQIVHTLNVTLVTGPGARSDAAIYHSHEDQTRRHPGDTAGRLLINAQARAEKLQWPEP